MNDKIRIGVYGPCENMGGTEKYLYTLHRVLGDYIVFDFLLNYDCGPIPFENEYISNGCRIYREYYNRSQKNIAGYISPKEIIKKHTEWEGIYINLQILNTTYDLLIEAQKSNIPIRVIHAHNAGARKSDFLSILKTEIMKIFFKCTYKKYTTDLLACSKLAGKYIFGFCEDVKIIPNSIDFNAFSINDTIRQKMRYKYHVKENEIVIGFCGRLSYQKNPKFLVEVFDELQNRGNYKLLIVGDGDLSEEIRTLVINKKIQEKVLMVGSVNNTEDYYQMMDCFLLPSLYEGFGIVLLEAQASGIRCYTTDKRVPVETNVTGRVTFISEYSSPAEWATIIENTGFDRVDCERVLQASPYSLEELKNKMLNVLVKSYRNG